MTFEPPSGDSPRTPRYWLMKAEPESRLERGHDIKFSIDDLAAKKAPEPWDGILLTPLPTSLALIDYRNPCISRYLFRSIPNTAHH